MKHHTGHVYLLMLLLAAPVVAQSLSGTVFDPSGGVVPNATVRITNVETNVSQSVSAAEDGAFRVSGLAPGKYRIDFEARGFAVTRETISLRAGEARQLFTVLPLGRVRESLAVTAKGVPSSNLPDKVRSGGKIEPPKLLKMTRPPYPELAKTQGITGTVILRATVLRDGAVGAVYAIKAPSDELARAAVGAVQTWRYQPAKLNGEPVEFEALVEIAYSLEP